MQLGALGDGPQNERLGCFKAHFSALSLQEFPAFLLLRLVQVLVSERTWRFKSSSSHCRGFRGLKLFGLAVRGATNPGVLRQTLSKPHRVASWALRRPRGGVRVEHEHSPVVER